MATLFLIRHAEPEMTGVFLGHLDSPLSVKGREQAAVSLREVRVGIAYTSPLLRATQTAAYVSTGSLETLPDLVEIHQGCWTGLTWAEIEARWPELAGRKSSDWLGVPPPDGESWSEVLVRAARVLAGRLTSLPHMGDVPIREDAAIIGCDRRFRLSESLNYRQAETPVAPLRQGVDSMGPGFDTHTSLPHIGDVAFVGHSGINAALFSLLTGADPLTFRQEYAEVIRVEYD